MFYIPLDKIFISLDSTYNITSHRRVVRDDAVYHCKYTTLIVKDIK